MLASREGLDLYGCLFYSSLNKFMSPFDVRDVTAICFRVAESEEHQGLGKSVSWVRAPLDPDLSLTLFTASP